MEDYIFDSRRYTLPNGLNVITIKRETQIACIHLGVKIGAMYESIEEKGLSHFLEHMMFKGTKKRNNQDINDDLEMLGGEYNAYTDYGCTVYSVTCLKEEILNGIEIIGDMIINSTLPAEEIEKERGVILSEIRSSMDDIEDLSFKLSSEKAYDKSPLRYDISGTESNVKRFNKEDLSLFYSKYYTPRNSYVVIVSPIEHEEIEQQINKVFGSWDDVYNSLPSVVVESNKPGIFESFKSDIEQNTIVYIYDLNSISRNDEVPLKILSHRLGESSNSILFRELRENRGLAYDVYTHLDLSENIKSLAIYTAVDKDSTDEAIEIINTSISNIKNRNIKFNDRTMEIMKKTHKTAVLLTLEDSTDFCNYIVHQCLNDESIYEFIDDMKILHKVDKEDIYKCADKYLVNPTIHILRNTD